MTSATVATDLVTGPVTALTTAMAEATEAPGVATPLLAGEGMLDFDITSYISEFRDQEHSM
jgi:hypothetical protein